MALIVARHHLNFAHLSNEITLFSITFSVEISGSVSGCQLLIDYVSCVVTQLASSVGVTICQQ